MVKTKNLVTALYRCADCELQFRVPKSSMEEDGGFYQGGYDQGFTTDMPSEGQLASLVASSFAGSEKDYATYISVLEASDVRRGSTILDFGSSWGYGSWQLRKAGYAVYSLEISVRRAKYAAEHLGCTMVRSIDELPEKVDCFFAAHVLEHFSDPRSLWTAAANAVREQGQVVLFMPNGDPCRAATFRDYHHQWGKVHPLFLTGAAIRRMARDSGFSGHAYSSPYDLGKVGRGDPGELQGDELLFVGTRSEALRPSIQAD